MTHAGNDTPTIWLKQVPNNSIHADGVWTQKLLAAHHTKRRAPEPDHGDKAICPTCEIEGLYDGGSWDVEFEKSVYFNAQNGHTVCVKCSHRDLDQAPSKYPK